MKPSNNKSNTKLEIIDRSGHYVHMDMPEALVEVATKFIELDI